MLDDFGIISEDEIIRSFGKRLKMARLKKGLTQDELGESLGIDKSRISDYENGNRRCSITTAYRLAKATGVSFDYLFDGKEDTTMKKYSNCNDKEKLISIFSSIGYAIIDWEFIPFDNDDFADYSTLFSIGLTKNSFGEMIHKFNNLKLAIGNEGSLKHERNIIAIAEQYADCFFSEIDENKVEVNNE